MIFHPTRNPRDYLNHWGSEEKSSGTGFKVSASLAATSAIPDTNLCTNSALNRWNSVEWPRFRLNSVDSIKFQKIFDSIRRFPLSFRSQQKIRKFSEKSEIPFKSKHISTHQSHHIKPNPWPFWNSIWGETTKGRGHDLGFTYLITNRASPECRSFGAEVVTRQVDRFLHRRRQQPPQLDCSPSPAYVLHNCNRRWCRGRGWDRGNSNW